MKTLQEALQHDLYKLADWKRIWGMLFSLDKCNTLQVTINPLMFTHSLKDQDLKAVNTAKYLGVDSSTDLLQDSHIDRTAKKANSMLGFLRRNLRINNSDTKAAAYTCLTQPRVSRYYMQLAGKQKIEMVQGRATRYATNRYHNTCTVNGPVPNHFYFKAYSK